jgi:hypothetical protein
VLRNACIVLIKNKQKNIFKHQKMTMWQLNLFYCQLNNSFHNWYSSYGPIRQASGQTGNKIRNMRLLYVETHGVYFGSCLKNRKRNNERGYKISNEGINWTTGKNM